MTFDQAQSPRLGQRTPVESTYVQIVDVDPNTSLPDLPEAAYPGQLIFRQDLGILQIWSFADDTWLDVAGGVAGQLTYVGPDEPTGGPFTIGDTWYDDDDQMKAYVWDGDSWEPSGVTGVQTYFATGWDPLSPDPQNPVWIPLDPAAVGVTAFGNGDIWYQTDDNNHIFTWNGDVWVDTQAPLIQQIEPNARDIKTLEAQFLELNFIATSANNTADTADGRVSMSDYQPGYDDVTYEQITTRMQQDVDADGQPLFDPDTGEPIMVEVTVSTMVPRVNGSIWFTRTRPRRNFCTNPSVETDLNGWAATGATLARAAGSYAPAGIWTVQVTNSALVEPHSVSFGVANRLPCEEGQPVTASVYAELITGAADTHSVHLDLCWYDSTGTLLSISSGAEYTLILNAFPAATTGTITEPRVWVTGVAPVGAVSYYVREVGEDSSASIVWNTGAMLIEAEDDLGRYFDGDSYDGYWDDTPHASQSYLQGDKIIEIWELRDESWVRKYLTTGTIYQIPAEELVGTLDGAILKEGSVTAAKFQPTPIVTSQALVKNDLVNVWNQDGTFRVRRANAAYLREAHGFVLADVALGDTAEVYHLGNITGMSALPPGDLWLSTTYGVASGRPPSGVGTMVQRVGYAPSETVLEFNPGLAIRIT